MVRRFMALISLVLLAAGCSERTDDSTAAADGAAATHELPVPVADPAVGGLTRFESNPLVAPGHPGNVSEWGYDNINGPTVIRVPDWIDEPLGRYYMYFAHHRGSFIRLAFADEVEGPWTIHEGGVLDLADTPALDHIASPDVHVDDASETIRMFFHSVDDTTTWKQTTYLATSSEGLRFEAREEPMGLPYLRAFELDGGWWAIAKKRGGPGGVLLQGAGPDGPFTEGPLFLPGMRHGAVLVSDDDRVDVVFSRIGDAPERLLMVTIEPERLWAEPYEPAVRELLRAETDYEGAHLPVDASAVGEETGPVHALRDPHVFVDEGETYLFYAVAGEYGIAGARWRR